MTDRPDNRGKTSPALGACAAATLAGASPFRTGLEAMRLGGVIYVAPFFFVLNPALVGVWFISAALQGHVSYVGGFASSAPGYALRLALFTAGLLFAAPGSDTLGLSHWQLSALGLVFAALPLYCAWRWGRDGEHPP